MDSTPDYELVRNAIALCSIAFDSKEWHLLKRCFTEDCVVDYPQPIGLTTGLSAYTERLRVAIGHLDTQHALTTQMINLNDANSAEATTYCRAIHFLDGRSFFAEAKYDDKLVRVSAEGPDRWQIKERKVTTMGVPRGDWSILG
ncbi:hypothetical protein ACJZ2D_001765 [Fusarium nematophilum]